MSLFSKPKTDASGQVSTVKCIGKFKGVISALNHTEKEAFEGQLLYRLELIKKMMKDIYKMKTNEDLEINMEQLENAEGRAAFIEKVRLGGMYGTKIHEYLI